MYEGPSDEIYVKSMQGNMWVTTLSLSSFVCCTPNLRNPVKLYENSNLQQFKVIQGYWSWCQSKAHMQFPI